MSRLALILLISVVGCRTAQLQNETAVADIVNLGPVRMTVGVPPGFVFTQCSLCFRIEPASGDPRSGTMHVYVTPSDLKIDNTLDMSLIRSRHLFGGAETRWWIYDGQSPPVSRFIRFADLLTGDGEGDCSGIVRMGLNIEGDDKNTIDVLMRVAAGMRIDSPCRFSDPEVVALAISRRASNYQ